MPLSVQFVNIDGSRLSIIASVDHHIYHRIKKLTSSRYSIYFLNMDLMSQKIWLYSWPHNIFNRFVWLLHLEPYDSVCSSNDMLKLLCGRNKKTWQEYVPKVLQRKFEEAGLHDSRRLWLNIIFLINPTRYSMLMNLAFRTRYEVSECKIFDPWNAHCHS